MKIHPVGAEMECVDHTDGQTYVMKLVVDFRNY